MCYPSWHNMNPKWCTLYSTNQRLCTFYAKTPYFSLKYSQFIFPLLQTVIYYNCSSPSSISLYLILTNSKNILQHLPPLGILFPLVVLLYYYPYPLVISHLTNNIPTHTQIPVFRSYHLDTPVISHFTTNTST